MLFLYSVFLTCFMYYAKILTIIFFGCRIKIKSHSLWGRRSASADGQAPSNFIVNHRPFRTISLFLIANHERVGGGQTPVGDGSQPLVFPSFSVVNNRPFRTSALFLIGKMKRRSAHSDGRVPPCFIVTDRLFPQNEFISYRQ